MAKPLMVRFGEQELPLELEKVERADIYGYVEVEAYSDAGKRCRLATLVQDGHTLIGSGGTAMGYVSPDGRWLDKSTLSPVGVDGSVIEPAPSTFSSVTELAERATVEDLLDHSIRSVYLLSCPEDWGSLCSELANGAIYRFPFSFRGGLDPDSAFLLEGADKNVFLLVGSPTRVEYVGISQPAPAADMEDEQGEEEDDLDFGMM